MEKTPALRASDAEREHTVEILRAHVVEGRLALDEFAQRLDSVYDARTQAELEELTRDLPEAGAAQTRPARRRPKRFTGVLFGRVERKGRWRVPRFAGLLVVFGDADLDLRAAEIDGEVVTITGLLLFGNADFYVPKGVDIDLGGLTIFGHRREHGDEVEPTPASPLIRIRVFSLFGTSDVWRIESGALGSFRELIASVRGAREVGPARSNGD